MQSFHNSNKSYFHCIRLAMISKQKITENLGGFILADSFHLSNKEKKTRKPNVNNFIPISLSCWEFLPLAHVLFSCWGLHLLLVTWASSFSSGGCQTLKSVHNKQRVTSVLFSVLLENAVVIPMSTFRRKKHLRDKREITENHAILLNNYWNHLSLILIATFTLPHLQTLHLSTLYLSTNDKWVLKLPSS